MFKKAFYLVFIMLLSINTSYANPTGYLGVTYEDGWLLYRKIGGENIYVQEINLQKNRINFVDWKISDQNFKLVSLSEKWQTLKNISYSLTNGSFFDRGANGLFNMSFPYKKNGKIQSMGWSTEQNIYSGELKMLAIGYDYSTGYKNHIAKVIDYDKAVLQQKNYTDILVGLSKYYDKSRYSKIGRTFVGVKDYSYYDLSQQRGIDTNLVYILTGVNLSQQDAIDELKKFGIEDNNIIMFDGSGSSQLFFEDNGSKEVYGSKKHNVNTPDKRSIPQAITVLPR